MAKKIYYVGDWAIQLGPQYIESSFHQAVKGTEIINYGKWLQDAIQSTGEYEVTSVPSWEFYTLQPGEYEKILASYDAVVFSDVEARNFQLAPSFFKHELFGKSVLTFPDRIRLTIEAVEGGLGVMFLGGWQSFNGDHGMGGWGRCRLRELLPVTCLDIEDLVESTEGYFAEVMKPEHPILEGMDFSELPPILGYNQVKPKAGAEVVARWKGTDDPLLAVTQIGKGRSVAYTSDPAPHWGCNFVFWEHYAKFWLNVVDWLVKAK
ncbi:MAG: glutamine amidotransferase [Planctomycetaceae bacterium]